MRLMRLCAPHGSALSLARGGVRAFAEATATAAAGGRRSIKPGPSFGDFLREAGGASGGGGCGGADAGDGQASPSAPPLDYEQVREYVRGVIAQDAALVAAGGEAAGLLKDTFGRQHNYLRISISERCNLRCTYCMPADGVELQPEARVLSTAEIVRLATAFVGAGVDKIRLTGGEPLVRPDVVELVSALGALPGLKALGITTNGITLGRKLAPLLGAGLTGLNISLDTLVPDKFETITRRRGFHRVLASIDAALAAGVRSVKVNCVVMRGMNEGELADFVALTEARDVEVRFIEWMPFDSNAWNDEAFVPFEEMLRRIHERYPALAPQPTAQQPNDTSAIYAVPGFAGRVGFITSMSQHFCASCNRLRLTADGELKTCLFGGDEVSLRDAMRAGFSDEELRVLVRGAVQKKNWALGGHGDMYGIAASENRPMILIGG